MPANDGTCIERISGLLSEAPKYRNLSSETLERISRWACLRYRSDKEILKAAKRKLHQVYAAYLTPKASARLTRMVGDPQVGESPTTMRDACREALSYHASTAERLPILEELYSQIFSITGTPRLILDLACGLHPFALPWMELPEVSRYLAMDIDCELMALIGDFFGTYQPGVLVSECRDIMVRPPEDPADLAFLLKAVPCLEQQERGASLRLLRNLRVRHAVVSFPARSLSGRSKGMEEHYAGMVDELLAELGVRAEVLSYPSEIFYVIELNV
jgi:16S rRNA (guanine(1405)-N(7))-methyltransferase